MIVDRNGIDLWRRVSDHLQEDIQKGVLTPGAKLPASSKLATRFGVHQHTVLKAISHLQNTGLLRVEQGRGTFVVEHHVPFRLGRQTWFEHNLQESHHVPTRTVLSVAELPAPAEVAASLVMNEGETVVLASLLGEADDVPVYIGRHYFPSARFPGIADTFLRFGSDRSQDIVFSKILAPYGCMHFRRKSARIRGRLPEADEMRHLKIGRSIPLIETRITLIDQQDEPVVYGIAAYCSDRVELTVDL